MQISLLCSTEHKEENMIFINSPFAILDEAFRSLYPDKKYKACIEPSIKDDATSFVKLQQRLVGAGQGISYEATSRDMSETNYSYSPI